MATATQLMKQRLPEFAIGEDVVQPFVGRFDTDISGGAFKFTLSAVPGSAPALVVTSPDITAAADADGDEFVITFEVPLERADTILLTQRDYRFDLWRTDTGLNTRIAAGVQPVVTPARLDS